MNFHVHNLMKYADDALARFLFGAVILMVAVCAMASILLWG